MSQRVAALLGAAALLGGVGVATARPISALTLVQTVTADGIGAAPTQRGGVSLAQATAMAQSRYHGKLVRAATYMQGDRMIHEIRILGDDGRVRTVLIDAQSGAFLN
ncbi:MAG TPA: PepSY domain-containing protein [Gammaproteobacteria bacterium]|nr:PepSY domain-containing protein [Gammaproteobacteria bacterium]